MLLKYDEQEVVAIGVIMMLTLAIESFTRGMPAAVVTTMPINMDKYIDALVDDHEVAQEAKDFLASL